MATKQYVVVRVERSVHKRLRRYERDRKRNKNFSATVSYLLDQAEEGSE